MSTNPTDLDKAYMRRCIQLARQGHLWAKPNPMVGAVIVHHGRIIGEGYHIRCGEAHAEVNAFAAVRPHDEHLLSESTVYVSLEPCSHYGKTPPCTDLIIKKRVPRVVCGCVDPFAQVKGKGIEKLRKAGIEVTVGVLEQECLQLNLPYLLYNTFHRPYILLKWAQTLNGLIDDNGQAIQLSTPFTQMLVHRLRAEYDAIVVGRLTDEREHPKLNVRQWKGADPLRLVLRNGQTIDSLLNDLYHRQVQTLIVEGGSTTLQGFIGAGLWDELRIETAPVLVEKGTKAPAIPPHAILQQQLFYDGNTIATYLREDIL